MPFGWRRRGFGYAVEPVDYETLKSKAKDLLSKAKLGESWVCGCGTKHIPIVVDGQIFGELWKDVKLSDVEVGSYWYSRRGAKVQLVKDGEVVGFVWIG